MSQLYRLAYISESQISGTQEQVKSQIENILSAAQKQSTDRGNRRPALFRWLFLPNHRGATGRT